MNKKPKGTNPRYDYFRRYYLEHRVKISKEAARRYLGKKTRERLCDTCEKNLSGKGCIEGFENLETLGIGNCRDYRPRTDKK